MKLLIITFLLGLSQFAFSEEFPIRAKYKASVNFIECSSSNDQCNYIFQISERIINSPLSLGTGNYPYDYEVFDGPTLDTHKYVHAEVLVYVAYDVDGKKYEIIPLLRVANYGAPWKREYNLGLIKLSEISALNETTLSTYFDFEGKRYKAELNLKAL